MRLVPPLVGVDRTYGHLEKFLSPAGLCSSLTFDARRLAGKPTCSAYYFFMVVVIIRYETTAAARWALLFIVRTFFNDAFTVAVWTSFHTCLMWS